jgi:hypothetical protein
MGPVRREHWLAALVAGPPILAIVAWLAVLSYSWTTGRHPIWTATPRNLAEAAALRDGAAVIRRFERGEGPNDAAEVRADILSHRAMTMKPLAAAAGARDREMVQLLLELGAVVDASVWQQAWCISNAPSVRDLLTTLRPPGATDYCDPAVYDY